MNNASIFIPINSSPEPERRLIYYYRLPTLDVFYFRLCHLISPSFYFIVKYINPFGVGSPLIWIWNPHITIPIYTPNDTHNMVGGYGMNWMGQSVSRSPSYWFWFLKKFKVFNHIPVISILLINSCSSILNTKSLAVVFTSITL